MKKRSVIQSIVLLSMLGSLTSCQEEEFYEKDYIETFKEKYEAEQQAIVENLDQNDTESLDEILEDDEVLNPDGSTDGSDGSNGTDGSDGSTGTDGSDGSTGTDGSDGSTGTDGSDGSTGTDGSDGSTGTDGSDGSTGTDGSDGSTGTDGSDGSTGTDGSDGSTGTDGSDGSTGTDGSTGNNGNNSQVVSDEFIQSASSLHKVDILWVIDNSGSMKEEQENLGRNFSAFIQNFSELGVDFKMSVTTTDTRRNNAGRPVKDSLFKLTSEKLAENRQQFLNDFANMVQVGTNGWGVEKGIKSSEVFSNRFANHHFRDDAYFIVIYVSDEEDQSEKSPENHLKQIAKWKSNPGLVKTYSIVDTSNPAVNTSYLTSGYARYKALSDLTSGYVADINEDFYKTLLKMGDTIAVLTKSFPLSKVPSDVNSIKVYVNGSLVERWSYDEANRTIKFEDGHAPAANANIKVTYEVEA